MRRAFSFRPGGSHAQGQRSKLRWRRVHDLALALIVALALLCSINLSAAGMSLTAPNTGKWQPTPPAEEVPEWLVNNVIRWRPLIQRWQLEFPYLHGTHGEALVMAVIAQESQGFADPNAVMGWPHDRVGSVGLMQVSPHSGRPSADRLLDPTLNTYWGMRILNSAIEQEEGWVAMGLARYNCGPRQKIEADDCGSKGGMHYARRVLDHYYPVFIDWLECPPLEATEQHKEDTGSMPETERDCE